MGGIYTSIHPGKLVGRHIPGLIPLRLVGRPIPGLIPLRCVQGVIPGLIPLRCVQGGYTWVNTSQVCTTVGVPG